MADFNSASFFPARKWEAVTQGGNRGYSIRRGEPSEPISSKIGRKSETAGALKIHSRKTRIKPPTNEPRLPPLGRTKGASIKEIDYDQIVESYGDRVESQGFRGGGKYLTVNKSVSAGRRTSLFGY